MHEHPFWIVNNPFWIIHSNPFTLPKYFPAFYITTKWQH